MYFQKKSFVLEQSTNQKIIAVYLDSTTWNVCICSRDLSFPMLSWNENYGFICHWAYNQGLATVDLATDKFHYRQENFRTFYHKNKDFYGSQIVENF